MSNLSDKIPLPSPFLAKPYYRVLYSSATDAEAFEHHLRSEDGRDSGVPDY
jgi:hypothetical protein